MGEIILETKNLTKQFPGVLALSDISIQIHRNKINVLCGENGAGKSTLINTLSGVYPYGSYSGQILLNGQEMEFSNIKDAEEAGIAVIHQELTLFPELNITENIFANNQIMQNRYLVDWNAMYSATYKWLDKLKIDNAKPTTKVGSLGVGKQQLIEIAKALIKKANILILDEPTASLTDSEVEILFDILNDLKEEGVTCIYISHKLDELFEIGDNVSVLRDGEFIDSADIRELDKKKIIKMMVGREINQMYPEKTVEPEETMLEVKNFNVYDLSDREQRVVKDASFELKKGEILGITGLMGAGRTELVSSIFGAYRGRYEGELYLDNQQVEITSPGDALEIGFAYVSEDRRQYGLIPTMDVRENTSIAYLDKFKEGFSINKSREIVNVRDAVKSLRVKTSSLEANIMTLSGGNQQKVLLARNLLFKPHILIIDEPTRGIDVGAKQEIYTLLNELTAEGISVIMVSSELPEVIGMSDRILVLHEGTISAEFENRDRNVSQEDIMFYATGGE